MKKMKRFLSLLICVVMLASFLPVGASAATINSVTVNFACPAVGDAVNLDNITLTNASFPRYATKTIKKDNQNYNKQTYEAGTYTIEFEIIPANFMQDQFANPLTVNTSDSNVKGNATITNGNYGWTTTKITLTFTVAPAAPATYAVTYDANGGEGAPEAQTKTENQALTLSSTEPTRIGYEFTGWNTKADGTGDSYEKGASYNKNAAATLYAQWSINQYTLTFKDGETELAKITQDYNTDVTAPADPTKTGHTFKGWDVKIPAKMPAEDRTINATWQINQYTITFKDGETELAKITQDYNTDVTAPVPTKEGYTFNGWNAEVPAKMPAENLTFTAQWTENGPAEYTVTFHANRNGVTDPEAKTVAEGGKVAQPVVDKVTEGSWYTTTHAVSGWYTDNKLQNKFDFENDTITEDTDLYAKWEQVHTVNFYGPDNQIVKSKDVFAGQTVNADGVAVEGYLTPSKWYQVWGGNRMEYDFSSPVNYGLNLYANWEEAPVVPTTFKVTFVTDIGTAPEQQTVEAGEKAVEPSPALTAAGYTFGGWYTDAACSEGKEYDFDAVVTADVTLYAKWTPKTQHTVTFDVNGHGTAIAAQTVYHGDKATKPADPVPESERFSFVGWFTEDNIRYNFEDPVTGNIRLIAKWAEESVKEFEITFIDTNTSEMTNTDGVLELEELPTPEAADGYTFGGWYEVEDENASIPENAQPVDEDTVYEKATYLKAKWNAIPYTITYDLASGSVETENPATYTVESDDITLTNPTKAGYTFAGWTGTGLDAATMNVTIAKGSTGNRSYTATWTANASITSITIDPTSVQKYPGETQKFTATVVGVGQFDNSVTWTVAPADGIAIVAEDEPAVIDQNGLLTLGANATGAYRVTVTSNADRTKLASAIVTVRAFNKVEFNMNLHGDQVPAQNLKAGEKATVPTPAPTAAGYTFGGWYTDAGCTTAYDFNSNVTGNITLYAKWTAVSAPVVPVTTYKVTYDANGGKGEMSAVTVESGSEHTLVANEFKAPTGKTFKCWKIGTKEYKAGEKITVTSDVTVKAVWKNKTTTGLDYVPASGDNFPVFLWVGLLLFSAVALTEVAILRRKRR